MKKEISLSGGKNRKYPSKTTLNLLVRKRTKNWAAKLVLFVILALLVLAFAAKFGVYDFLIKKQEAQQEVDALNGTLAITSAGMDDYDQVMEELNRLSSDYLNAEELQLVNRMELLNVLDRCIGSYGVISSVGVSGNTASISCTIPDLSMISRMISTLTREPLVQEVTVSSASGGDNTQEDSNLSVSVTIKMANPSEEG